MVVETRGNLNYLLIGVLFLLPTILLILGVILFLNASPPAVYKTRQRISASVVKSNPPAKTEKIIPETVKSGTKLEVTVEPVMQKPDLMKRAGNFFGYVFDTGVFSEPSNAHASHQFLMDPESKTVFLRVDYDVSPKNSFSAAYFKTRNLDLSKVKSISFSTKADENKPIPDRFRIEFKNKSSAVRRFSVAPTSGWQLYHFDFNVAELTDISEMAIIFEHSKVGAQAVAGTVYLKDLTIQ